MHVYIFMPFYSTRRIQQQNDTSWRPLITFLSCISPLCTKKLLCQRKCTHRSRWLMIILKICFNNSLKINAKLCHFRAFYSKKVSSSDREEVIFAWTGKDYFFKTKEAIVGKLKHRRLANPGADYAQTRAIMSGSLGM